MSNGEVVSIIAIATQFLWLVLAIVSARLGLEVFYLMLRLERFALIKRGEEVVRVVWYSLKYRLVFSTDPEIAERFPHGRFLPIEEKLKDDEYLGPKLGPVEWILGGYRFIGLPGLHSPEAQVMSWTGIGSNGEFINHQGERRTQFAITAPFSLQVSGLTVGGDTDHTTAGTEDDEVQRLSIRLIYYLQIYTYDPVGSIMRSKWMPQVLARIKLLLQPHLGKMSIDEFIMLKAMENNVLQTVLGDPSLGAWGVRIIVAESSYEDWEIEGDTDGSIKAALVAKFVGREMAKKIEAEAKAGRAGVIAVIESIRQTAIDMKNAGIPSDIIADAVKGLAQMAAIAGHNGDGGLMLGGAGVATMGEGNRK